MYSGIPPSAGSLTVNVTCDDASCPYHTEPYPLVADVTETVTTPATCTQPGVSQYTAQVSLDGYSETYTRSAAVPAEGHLWDSDEVEWLEDGQVRFHFVCIVDETHTQDVTVQAHAETVTATCTQPGVQKLTATATLGDATAESWRFEDVPALGHDWNTDTVTTGVDGDSTTVTVACRRDGSHTQTVPAQMERVSSACVAATCTSPGKEVFRMAFTLEGQTYYLENQEYTIPAQPHAWGAWEPIDPADGDGNTFQHTCAVCGAVEKSREQHVYTLPETAEWKIEDGQVISVTVHALCDGVEQTLVFAGDQIAVDEASSQKATCTAPGRTVYTVTAALGGQSKTYTQTVQEPAKGHTWISRGAQWSDDYSQVTVTFLCLRCRETIEKTVDTTALVLAEPDCDTEGLTSYSAEIDMGNTHYQTAVTASVPPLGHSWDSDGTCTRCSARKPAESADVKVTVPADPDAPAVTLPAESRLALENAVLTAKDRALLADGIPITIRLEVTDADDTVPEADALAVADALAGMPDYALGQYLDVSLFKTVGLGGQKTPIADTGTRQITLQLAVPEALQAAERTFRIIRVHDGAADVLDDLDSDPATITFRTNLFSTYAIVYTDGPAATETICDRIPANPVRLTLSSPSTIKNVSSAPAEAAIYR